MKTVLINYNLLGDGLFSTPAIRAYRKKVGEDHEIIMCLNDQQFQRIHEGNPYVNKILYINDEQYKKLKEKYGRGGTGRLNKVGDDFGCVLDCSEAFSWCSRHPKISQVSVKGSNKTLITVPHFCYGFAAQLDVSIDNCHYDVQLTEASNKVAGEVLEKYKKPVILCAALSKSCTSRSEKPEEKNWPANKMLSPQVWEKVIATYPEYDFVFLAAPGEELLLIKGSKWELGHDIRAVASMCKHKNVKCVVSIDTGISHVAGAVDANLLLVAAAVPSSLTQPETKGKSYTVDHSQNNPIGPYGIHTVTPDEIIEGIKVITQDG